MRRRYSFFENIGFLVLIGVIAGALGGLAIGVVTGRPASTTTSTTK